MIYFLLNEFRGAVKIGYASSMLGVQKRIYVLQLANVDKLEVLAVIDGAMSNEKLLHKRFKELRRRGEWFWDDPSIRAYITSTQDLYSPIRERRAAKRVHREQSAARLALKIERREAQAKERAAQREQTRERYAAEREQRRAARRVIRRPKAPAVDVVLTQTTPCLICGKPSRVGMDTCQKECQRKLKLVMKLSGLLEDSSG